MPGISAYDVGVLINETDASRWFKTFGINYSLGYEDATTFGSGGFTEKAITLADFSLSSGGTLRPTDHPTLRKLAASSAPMTIAVALPRNGDATPKGMKAGNICVLAQASSENFNRRGPVNGLVGYDFNMKSAGDGVRAQGRVILPPTEFTATTAAKTATTPVIDWERDLSATVKAGIPAGEGRLQIHVMAMPVAITAASVTLERSAAANFGAAADVKTVDVHTALGSGKTGAVIANLSATETVARYLSVSVDLTGASSAAKFKVAVFYAE